MSEGTSYNGWTNYETWLVALWIDNSEGDSQHWRGIADELRWDVASGLHPSGVLSESERWHIALADRLKHEIRDHQIDAGLFADLLNSALSEVNWLEIARNITSEGDDDTKAAEKCA